MSTDVTLIRRIVLSDLVRRRTCLRSPLTRYSPLLVQSMLLANQTSMIKANAETRVVEVENLVGSTG
jgi:hypothetical protein